MNLPKQICPKTQKKDCPICGKYLGWIDLNNPGRSPTKEEINRINNQLQELHDSLRIREFNSLKTM